MNKGLCKMMEKSRIKAIALSSWFKLKEQPNGEMDLNPYVYEFAKLLELNVSGKQYTINNIYPPSEMIGGFLLANLFAI